MIKNYKYILALIISLVSLNNNAISREERILNRIKPIGTVNLTEGAQLDLNVKPKLGRDAGLKRYKTSCYICHDTGASGAPKLNDKSAWSSRRTKGKNTLYEHVIKGYNAMPAKGGCLNCSDEEIKLSVDYMLQKTQ